MKQRVISGFIIGVFIVVFGVLGGYPLALLLMVCSMIGYRELAKACGVLGEGERQNALTIVSYMMAVFYYIGLMVLQHRHAGDPYVLLHSEDFFTVLMLTAAFLITMAVYVFTFPKYRAPQVMASYFSFVYAPVLMSFVYRARLLPYGVFVYALVFVCSSVCDVCALLAGMKFGRHKMAPVLSPKKTVEGGVGGIIGATLGAWIVALLVPLADPGANLQLEFILIGAVGAFISMIGDLAASAIKRNHNIKDYGNLIPGHGGIMDRFDSIIFTAPVIYFMGVLLLGIATGG